MARGAIERLKAKIEKVKPKRGRDSVLIADGANLYLQVHAHQERDQGRRQERTIQPIVGAALLLPGRDVRHMGLGNSNDVSLAQAREWRKLISEARIRSPIATPRSRRG
jgi:hypothetical protein